MCQKNDRLLCVSVFIIRSSPFAAHSLTPVFQLVRDFQAKNMIRRIFFSMCKKKKQETGKFEGEGDGSESGYQKKYFFEVPVQPFLFSVCVFNYVTFVLSEPFSGGPSWKIEEASPQVLRRILRNLTSAFRCRRGEEDLQLIQWFNLSDTDMFFRKRIFLVMSSFQTYSSWSVFCSCT